MLMTLLRVVHGKKFVADYAREAMERYKIDKPLDGPLMIKIRFGFPLPKSQYRKNPKPMMWHMKRPDLDNLYKGVIDAMEGIVYHRDSEIVKVMDKVIVPQGDAPYVNLAVVSVEENLVSFLLRFSRGVGLGMSIFLTGSSSISV